MIAPSVFLFVLITNVQCANILGIFPAPSISHQVVFQPIWRELSLRGHQVTVLTPNPLKDPALVNLTEIDASNAYDAFKNIKIETFVSKDLNSFSKISAFYEFVDILTQPVLENSKFQELLADKNNHFDLIMVEYVHPVVIGVAGRFKAPIVYISTFELYTPIHEIIGNPSHPALHFDLFLGFPKQELSVWQKMHSIAYTLWFRFWYHHIFIPRQHKVAVKYFGDIPYLGDLERNISMVFTTSNPFLFPPRPNVPLVVELGMMHIQPVKPLPKDLQTFLDDSKEGVIYFSLGSNVKSVNMPDQLKKTVLDALSELPYKVLWKWESDYFPGKSDNVVVRKWLPQQDILAHKNVKVFVTQGGLRSVEESIARGVPLVGMPFIGDQAANVRRIVDIGIGLEVDPITVTKEELKSKITEVVENRKYKDKVEEIRDIVFDKPQTGLEEAVWWLEYVIRHKGTRHLRSSTADISWFHYLLLDVVGVVAAGVFFVVFVFRKVLRYLFHRKNKLKQH